MKIRIPLMALAASTALLAVPPAQAAGPGEPSLSGEWVRCTDSGITDTTSLYYGSVTCGGDPLTGGGAGVVDPGAGTNLAVAGITGANPFTLYEVYWLPVGAQISSAVKIGGFVTDCNGNTPNPYRPSLLRDIVSAMDARTGAPVDFTATVGSTTGAGVFVAYSRGPYSNDDPATTCPWPTTFNTVNDMLDDDPTAQLANPAVDPAVDSIQFISGFNR